MNRKPSQPRFELWKSPLAIGPIVFTATFVVRSFIPVLDPLVLLITLALVGVVGLMLFGHRWAGAGFLVFPVALFTSPAGREFSFNLSSIDNKLWRLHAVVGLVGLGVGTVAAILVMLSNEPKGVRLLSSIGVGAALGGLMVVAIASIYAHPSFGQDLNNTAIAELPTIEMLNYAYDVPELKFQANEGLTVRVNNSTNLPHTMTIDSLGIELYVPAGRFSVLELTAAQLQTQKNRLPMYCSVGEHQALGMARILDFARVGAP